MSIATICTCGKSLNGYCNSRVKECIQLIKNEPQQNNMSHKKYTEQDVRNIISMVCEQFEEPLSGRTEFIDKTIETYAPAIHPFERARVKWVDYIKKFEKLNEFWNNLPPVTALWLSQQIDIFAGVYPPKAACGASAVWVRCSDRLPVNEGIYKVKRFYSDKEEKAEYKGGIFTNYQGYVVCEWLDESASPAQSGKEYPWGPDEYPDLSASTPEQKHETIFGLIQLVAKEVMRMFYAFGLKTHIECTVVNDPTNETFDFIFRKKGFESGKEDAALEIERRNKIIEENMKLGMRINMPGISTQEQENTWQEYKQRNNL